MLSIVLASIIFLLTVAISIIEFFIKNDRKRKISIISLTIILGTVGLFLFFYDKHGMDEAILDKDNIKKYGHVSKLSTLGAEILPGKGISLDDPLYNLLKNNWKKLDTGYYDIICDNDSENRFKKVIETYPEFPFSYYGMAICKFNTGDTDWKNYAKRAIDILKITTSFAGHNLDHDARLEELEELLK